MNRPVRRLRVFLLLLAVLPAFAACGQLPRPFAHDPGAPPASVLRPIWANPVTVVPPENAVDLFDETAAHALAQGVADGLTDAEIPALVSADAPGGYVLTGTVEPLDPPGPDLQEFKTSWVLLAPDGTVIAVQDVSTVVLNGDLTGDADGTVGTAGRNAAQGFVAPLESHMMTLARSGGADGAVSASTETAAFRTITIGPISGLPEDRAAFLASALESALRRTGLTTTDPKNGDGTAQVNGRFTASAEKDGQRLVEMAWTVLGPDGQELGKIEQANAVPARLLDNGFAALATAISSGGADGIAEVLRSATRAR